MNGGDKEARTPDPLLAKQMLYQLSYIPVEFVNEFNKKFLTNEKNLNTILLKVNNYEIKFFKTIKTKTSK